MIWLIAEDETDILTLLAMVVDRHGGISRWPFPSGQKVWDWLDKIESGARMHGARLPDFALMDIRMPGKKGNEVANRMRTIPVLPTICPWLLMTALFT